MKARLLGFIDALRATGLAISVAEALDAMHAVGVIGVERAMFRECLAATLVKDEAERPTFEAVFNRFFAAPSRQRGKGARSQPATDGDGRGKGPGPGGLPPLEFERPSQKPSRQRAHAQPHDKPLRPRHEDHGQRLARKRALQNLPFAEMSGPQVEECDALVAELAQRFHAHMSRRRRSTHRGRLDVRRTLRRSISRGGVPIDPAFQKRRPGQPDLVAMCDHSHSVATASRFMLAVLTPAAPFFRRVRLFAFVDRPVEVTIEGGLLVPHEQLDLYARSDFGQVLVEFWKRYEVLLTRNTVLLILGDARNNRRPSRTDLLARMRRDVRQVVWLNPEQRARWNTADSVIRMYEPHCDQLLSASTIRELYTALRRAFRAP